MQVRDAMSRDILKVGPGDSALETGLMMDSRHISAALVLEKGRLRGIVSKETFIAHMSKLCERPLESLTVSDFMEADIDTVKEDADIKVAVELLLMQNSIIDRLPVLSEGEVVGLISKADFTRLFAEEMAGKYRVADLMQYSPVTVADYTPLAQVVDEMMNLGVKRVIVLSGEKLAGIISVKDLSLMLFREKVVCKGTDPMPHLTAEDAMTRNPITVNKKAHASEAAGVMVGRGIGGIPVVNNRLEGILTRTDLLKGYQLSLG